jgi:hypothetical protein
MSRIKKRKSSNRYSLAQKAIIEITNIRNQKVIDFEALIQGNNRAGELNADIVSEEKLKQYDPLHAIYIYAQNMISVIIEQLMEIRALSTLVAAYDDADDEYMPEGPPVSPLTKSHFIFWGSFDLYVGLDKESLGTIAIEVFRFFNGDPDLLSLFQKMQNSRMGFYVHEGVSGEHILFRELVTDIKIKALSPTGYNGKKGEIWLMRVMPEPFNERPFGYFLIFTTPYVVGINDGKKYDRFAKESEWVAFFDRTLVKTGEPDKIKAYENLMKYGLNQNYWNEYILEAYVNYIPDAILLAGFPDIPLSRPCSKESMEKSYE